MSESIIVSMNGDQTQLTISTEHQPQGEPADPARIVLLVARFIGNRPVFFRTTTYRAPRPMDTIDWEAVAKSYLGVPEHLPCEYDATNCRECGRLQEDHGLCGECADKKSGFSQTMPSGR